MSLLDGLTVLDFTQYLAGPWCTEMLSALGARVIKIEIPGTGDPCRGQPPFLSESGLSLTADDRHSMGLAFWKRNGGKESVAINLRANEGRELIKRLGEHVDVVVQNFRPGVAERLGIGPNEFWDIREDIVYCSISGYGAYRPPGVTEDALPAADLQIQAVSGVMAITGFPESPPTKMGSMLTDHLTGVNAAVAILAALYGRNRSGSSRGESQQRIHVEVPMVVAASALVWDEPNDFYLTRGLTERRGNSSERLAPFGIYRAGDGGYVAIGAGYNRAWVRLVSATGIAAFQNRADLDDLAGRMQAKEYIDSELEAWAALRTRNEIIEILSTAGVEVAAVNSIRDILSDELFKAYCLRQIVDDRYEEVDAVAPKVPIFVNGEPAVPERSAPRLGEDTTRILSELCNLDELALKRLVAGGILATE